MWLVCFPLWAWLDRTYPQRGWVRPRAPWPFTWPGWSQKRGLHAPLKRSCPSAPKWIWVGCASVARPQRLIWVTPEASSRDVAWQPRLYKRHSQELPEGFILLCLLSWSCRMPPAPRIWALQGPFVLGSQSAGLNDCVSACVSDCVSSWTLHIYSPTFTSYSWKKNQQIIKHSLYLTSCSFE